MINKISLKRNAVLNGVKTLMGLIFPLITFPYASRILLPEGIGKVTFVFSLVSYFTIISSLGIDNYGIREAAKKRDNREYLSQFTKEILLINIFSTIAAYFFLVIAIIFLDKISEYRVLLVVTSASILFTTLGINWLYAALEDYYYITIRSITFQIISLVLLFLFVHTKEDYVKYAVISVFSNVGSNILNFIHSKKYIKLNTGRKANLKKHMKPIFILFFMAIAIKIYTVLDTTMLGFIKGDYEVGIYTAATKINKIVLSLVIAVTTVTMPRLSYYMKSNNKIEFANLAYKSFDLLFLLALPCTIGLSILSEPIVLLLCGYNYSAAILPMRIMNPIVIIIGIGNVIGVNIFLSMNKEVYKLYSVIAGATVNIGLNLWLIPIYGSLGASVSTVVAEGMVSIIQLILVRKYLNLKPVFKSFSIYLINSIIMSIPVVLCLFFCNSLLQKILIGSLVGFTTYFFMLYLEKDKFVNQLLKFKVIIKNK